MHVPDQGHVPTEGCVLSYLHHQDYTLQEEEPVSCKAALYRELFTTIL